MNETIDFFDTEWAHQEFVGLTPGVFNAQNIPHRPTNLSTQLKLARELSRGIPFSRIDLYDVEDKVIFGEITLYPNSGVGKFSPPEQDMKLGECLTLKKVDTMQT